MFGFGWVGGSRQNGCSDFKIRWLKKFKTNGFFYCGCSDLWVGGWVTINPNIVRIFKSVGINGRSLSYIFRKATKPGKDP